MINVVVLIVLIGLPSFHGVLESQDNPEKFINISVEALVEGRANAVYVTQKFLVKTAQKNIKHGLILNFPNYDRTYSPQIGPLEYSFLSASIDRRAETGRFTRMLDLPIARIKSEGSQQGVLLKLGDDSVELPPGQYLFSVEYRVRNSIFPMGERNEGTRVVVAKPYGFVADRIDISVLPPGMAKAETVLASAWVQEKISQDGKSLLKNVRQVTPHIAQVPSTVNAAREPVSMVTVNSVQEFGESESLVLNVLWPRGFATRE